MYINKQYFKGYTQGGWCEPFAKADLSLTYRYNPKLLTKYRTQYIRRAINTGFVPETGGPTNAMCMMLFWKQRARYVARAGNFSTHIQVFENELAKELAQQFVTVDAKLKLMKEAFGCDDTPRWRSVAEYSIHINGASPFLHHWLPEDYRSETDSTQHEDVTPFGACQLHFTVHHGYGKGGKAIRNMLNDLLQTPWYSDQHKQAALAQMYQPFNISVNMEMRRTGYYGTDDRITIE
jgi:hypothetical protein